MLWAQKLWTSYRIAGRNEEPRADIAWKINHLQTGLGLEKSQFPELEGMGYDDEEEENEVLTDDEWSSEDKQLLKEEIESEKENDDW
jgi:hypothetical protein